MVGIPKQALQLSEDLSVALHAASKAGEEMLRGYELLHHVSEKGVADLVCEVDFAADRAILEHLQQMRPADPVISEELAPSKTERRGRGWVVDPLDATSAFIFKAGRNLPSVLIALRDNGITQLGVAFFPLTGEWFYAVRGMGSYRNSSRLSTANHSTDLSKAWVDMNQYGDVRFETSSFARLRERLRSRDGARLVTSQVPHSGVTLRIAEGRQHISAVIHDNNLQKVKQQPWDTAAVQLILEEAGGVFLNLKGEHYHPFNPEPIVAASSHDLAMQIIRLLES